MYLAQPLFTGLPDSLSLACVLKVVPGALDRALAVGPLPPDVLSRIRRK